MQQTPIKYNSSQLCSKENATINNEHKFAIVILDGNKAHAMARKENACAFK
jgi:hypothetical protein